MRQLNALTRAVTATLRQLLGARNVPELNRPTMMCPWLRRDLFEPLEGRAFTDTPVSPGLSVQYFATLDPTLASSFVAAPTPTGQLSVVTDLTQQWANNPVDGSNTPFRVRFTGTIDVPDTNNGAPVLYYFRLPKAEGAVITIDGQSVILQPSLPGDTDLNGSVTFGDYQNMMANYGGSNGPYDWTAGDFNGDGQVGFGDYQALMSDWGQTVTARTIDNTNDPTNNPVGPVGFLLTPGPHTLQFDFYQFNASGSPNDQLTFSTQFDPTNFQSLSALMVSPYVAPHVSGVGASAVQGQAFNDVVATFAASAPNTSTTDYTASVQWSDAQSNTAQVVDADNGVFAVVDQRAVSQAGAVSGTVTVLHTPSGFSGSSTTTLSVADAPSLHPTANGPSTIGEGQVYTLNLDSAVDEGAPDVNSWSVNWGDGQTDTLDGDADHADHVYADGPNAYNIQATAITDAGSFAAQPRTVSVQDVAPRVTVTGSVHGAGHATISLAAPDPGAADGVNQWTVDWGDGHVLTYPGTAASEAHTFDTTNGPQSAYTVRTTANTDEGDFAADPLTLEIDDNAPVANADPVATLWRSGSNSGIGLYPLTNDTDPDGDALKIQSVAKPAHGTATTDGNSIWYVPDPVQTLSGLDTITFTETDGFRTTTGTVTVDVAESLPSNMSVPITFIVTPEEPTQSIPYTPRVDSAGNPWTLRLVTPPSNGTVVFDDGYWGQGVHDFTYTGGSADDLFTLQWVDGQMAGNVFSVSVGAPRPVSDGSTLLAGPFSYTWGDITAPLTVSEGGTLQNRQIADASVAADPDYGHTAYRLVADDPGNPAAAGRQLTFNADGSFTYKPPAGFVGQDWFTYVGHTTGEADWLRGYGIPESWVWDSPFHTVIINVQPLGTTLRWEHTSSAGLVSDTRNLLLPASATASDGAPPPATAPNVAYLDASVSSGTPLADGTQVTLSVDAASADKVRVWLPTSDGYQLVLGGSQGSSKTWTVTNGGIDDFPINETTAFLVEGLSTGDAPITLAVNPATTNGATPPAQGGAPTTTAAVSKTVTARVVPDVLDIDSDNDDGTYVPLSGAAELATKDDPNKTGKVIYVNDSDSNSDGIPDFANGFKRYPIDTVDTWPPPPAGPRAPRFVPLMVHLPSAMDPTKATVTFHYDASDPNDVSFRGTTFTPAKGTLRLWLKDATDASRTSIGANGGPGDFVPSDVSVKYADLAASGGAMVYVEAVRPSKSIADQRVVVTINPGDGTGAVTDAVRLTAVDVRVLVGATKASDESVNDDWVGAPSDDGTHTHTIDDLVRVTGPANFTLPVKVDAAQAGRGSIDIVDPTSGTKGPLALNVTTDATGQGSMPFYVRGTHSSSTTEDTIVTATAYKTLFASETLTVVKFATSTITDGVLPYPINPQFVSAESGAAGGNLFAVDTGHDPVNDNYNTDQLPKGGGDRLSSVSPSLWLSPKISPDKIAVVWARDAGQGTAIPFGKSTSDKSLRVNPTSNGIGKSVGGGSIVPDRVADHLRMRDTGLPALTIGGNGPAETINYYFGHPSETGDSSLAIANNWAASFTTQRLRQIVYPVALHMVTLAPATTSQFTAADLTEVMKGVNAIWSQAGISFNVVSSTSLVVTKTNQFDVTLGYNHMGVGTWSNKDVTAQSNNPSAIDIYFVNTIKDQQDIKGSVWTTLTGNTVWPADSSTPGCLLAANAGLVFSNPITRRLQWAHSLAHELGHYLLNKDDSIHAPEDESWNLMVGGGQGVQRFLDKDRATTARQSDPTATK